MASKVYCTFELHPKVKAQLLAQAQITKKLGQAEALICDLTFAVSESFLKKAPALKVVGTCSAGTNHVDRQALQKRGIPLINTPGVLTGATAELALTLLLAVSRRLTEGQTLCRSGKFKGWKMDLLLGQSLAGKKAVLVGKGKIGTETARLFSALGLEVQFVTRTTSEAQISELLKQAQVLSFHCPLTPETRHWLSAKRMRLLAPSCIVINTARGEVIDEKALILALKNKKLFGAGLDVFENEPEIPASLRKLSNVVLLPHVGSATVTTRLAMQELVVSSVCSMLRSHA